nr:aminoacyl-tRNA synthetase, class 1a, anticodon-binding [Tanacetum cinerariifolium]
MAALKYKEEHNKVGYLLKPTGSNDYHQIIDFLSASHIRYGLVRSRLDLADDGGIADLPILEIYYGMDNLGYVTEGKLTFFKNKFSPQWRFLQIILGIETRVTRQYKVLAFSSKHFVNMRLNFVGHPILLLPAILLQAQAGGVLEHDHSSDQHETTAGSFPTREDAPLGGDFHTSPPRSSHAPPAGQPSREDGNTQDVDLYALHALANATVAVDSDIPFRSTLKIPAASPCAPTAVPPSAFDVPLGASDVPLSASNVPPTASDVSSGASDVTSGTSVVTDGSPNVPAAASVVPAGSPNVVVNEDSDDEDSDDDVWSAVVGWEVFPTPLGAINALYRINGGKGSCVWKNQHLWEIRSWRLYTLSNVHVLETVFGEVLSMFTDVSYPLSVTLMEKMLMHKLEIDSYFVGNDLTTAEQLIQFIKNQLVAAQASSV